MTSRELAEGLRTVNPLVIETIYNGSVGKRIKRIVEKYGANQLEAEDILTPTITRAILLIDKGRYVENGKCEEFLITIARFIWREELKRKENKVWKNILSRDIGEDFFQTIEIEGDFLRLEEEIEAAKERQFLLNHIDQLDSKCKELIRLRYLQGYQLNEIEEIMGLTKNYPNVLHGRCLKKLRLLIGNKWPEQDL